MSDRTIGFTVSLNEPLREEEVEALVIALNSLKNVAKVDPVIASPEFHIARVQARRELTLKMWKILEG